MVYFIEQDGPYGKSTSKRSQHILHVAFDSGARAQLARPQAARRCVGEGLAGHKCRSYVWSAREPQLQAAAYQRARAHGSLCLHGNHIFRYTPARSVAPSKRTNAGQMLAECWPFCERTELKNVHSTDTRFVYIKVSWIHHFTVVTLDNSVS